MGMAEGMTMTIPCLDFTSRPDYQYHYKSYFTDLIYKITPQPDPADALKRYGMDLFHYLDILRYIVSISYLAVLSFIASFPLAAYFNISSAFFKSIWKAKKKA